MSSKIKQITTKGIIVLFMLTIQYVKAQTGNNQTASKNTNLGDKEQTLNTILYINGKITAVTTLYADYVFNQYYNTPTKPNPDYKFPTLSQIEAFIIKNKHLPGITPITELEKIGKGYTYSLTDLAVQNLEKTEELYLHLIEQQKQIEQKNNEIKELKKEIKNEAEQVNSRLEKLEQLNVLKNKL